MWKYKGNPSALKNIVPASTLIIKNAPTMGRRPNRSPPHPVDARFLLLERIQKN
jgi:hypothetical protein